MRSQEKNSSVAYEAFDAGSHLSGVVGICRALEWDNFRYDSDLTCRSLTAPGVTTHLGLLAVDERCSRNGIGRGLVEEAFARTGAERMDLIASDESLDFYRSFECREQVGFRIYAGRREEG